MILLTVEPLTRRESLDPSKFGFDYFLSSYPELQNFTSIEGVMTEIQIRIPKEYFESGYQMTVGDKWATGITIASGVTIAYVLEMHKEGKEIIPKEIAQDLRNFDAKDISRGMWQYEQRTKKEVLKELKEL